MKVSINKGLRNEINKAIDNLSLEALADIKEAVSEDLVNNGISENEANGLLHKEISIDDISEDNKYVFLHALHKNLKNKNLNPEKYVKREVEVELDENGKPKKPSKDNMPEFYYDYDFKVKFANRYNEATKKVVLSLFRKSKDFEYKFDKDVCNFNIRELKEFFKSLKSKTIRSLQNQISTIETYVKFAQLPENREGKTELKVNYATAFDSRDKLEELLFKEAVESMILEEEDVMSMAEQADNPQDGVIPALLFTGVSHKNEFEELINLTIKDVDLDNKKIKLEGRELTMSDETTRLVKRAYEQDVYFSINGENVRRYAITEGDNILRGLRKKLKVRSQNIGQRINRIASIWTGEEFDKDSKNNFINATTLSYSGQIHLAKQLLDKGMELDKVVDEVLHTFAIPNNESSRFYLRTRIENYLEIN